MQDARNEMFPRLWAKPRLPQIDWARIKEYSQALKLGPLTVRLPEGAMVLWENYYKDEGAWAKRVLLPVGDTGEPACVHVYYTAEEESVPLAEDNAAAGNFFAQRIELCGLDAAEFVAQYEC